MTYTIRTMKQMSKIKSGPQDFKKAENWEIWEKEVSEFPWKYHMNETCLILKGSATVKDFNGNEISFAEGDLVTFKKGLECLWKIHEDMKKKYILF